MSDFIEPRDRALLQRHGLDDFEALWKVRLPMANEPNRGRGGWSQAGRLDLGEAAFHLKRQSNQLIRTPLHPFGEASAAREFRRIRHYQHHGIPALRATFFGERRIDGERRAILVTRALDGWRDLDSWLAQGDRLAQPLRDQLTDACGRLAHALHAAGERHGRLYPEYIFMRAHAGAFEARLIDLETTRRLLFGRLDRVRDLQPLLRRALVWCEHDVRNFLAAYLRAPAASRAVDRWQARLERRRRRREAQA